MENATKALLISASVLIAIVLIALGVNLLGSVGDTTNHAEQVGEALKNGVANETDKLIGSMSNTMSLNEMLQLQKDDRWHGEGSEFYQLMKSRYVDYRFRVYTYNKKEPQYFSEQLWNNSKVITTKPTSYGYRFYQLLAETKTKRAIWIIIPNEAW